MEVKGSFTCINGNLREFNRPPSGLPQLKSRKTLPLFHSCADRALRGTGLLYLIQAFADCARQLVGARRTAAAAVYSPQAIARLLCIHALGESLHVLALP